MAPFLLTLTVLGASIYAGYRLNMYLFTRGAVGASLHQVQFAGEESSPVRPPRNGAMVERDYSVRYARTGILILACATVLVAFGLMVAIFALL